MGSTSIVEIASLIHANIVGNSVVSVSGVSLDSNKITRGELFAALPGRNAHGAQFAEQAISRGANAILTDPVGLAALQQTEAIIDIPILCVDQPREHLGEVCKLVFENPSADMLLLGVTGTNGKSTTTSMIYQAARAQGLKAGLIGTLATMINGEEVSNIRTTPEAPDLYRTLATMKEAGVVLVAMEVSSIALSEHRVDGLTFACVGFTNLSHDHLDYHGSMEEYFSAKAQLFTPKFALSARVCVDNPWGRELSHTTEIPCESIGITESPDWLLTQSQEVGGWTIHGPTGELPLGRLSMPGAINALNATLALSMLDCVGVSGPAALNALRMATVTGRGELVAVHGSVSIYVDYAHSPDSIREFLSGLQNQSKSRVITVLGAGGDRDSSKRGEMGRVAGSLSEVLIVTDDNPRSEVPERIREEIVAGAESTSGGSAHEVHEVGDRREAIALALAKAEGRDVIAILGKGHEKGQEVSGRIIPFSDIDVVEELLESSGEHD